jgi:hypothetical protein
MDKESELLHHKVKLSVCWVCLLVSALQEGPRNEQFARDTDRNLWLRIDGKYVS